MSTNHKHLQSPDAFLLVLKKTKAKRRSESTTFIETYQELIVEGIKQGYSSVVMFRAFKSSGTPPPMSHRQFRRYVSRMKRERLLTVAPVSGVTSSASAGDRPVQPVLIATERKIEKKAIELNASSAKEAPVFKQKTFDWNPLATFDDHA
ncbi:hypothetical protein [uncultured Thiocystis sp.]|jgi:hypothetical protein|uniref:hypothetical protein n=1 Tax=uncultured Thiocystis sp. TaxID=1202134 RepID=UPI0025D6C09B|nr:hypothetical protein [uncultured Thiocystis sp.]